MVTYTGTGSAGTIGHGLGVAPSVVIGKSRDAAADWQMYHKAIGPTQLIRLNLTTAAITNAIWQNTNPTSSIFYISNSPSINVNGDNNVAYCFADVEGFSKFGSFTANGSADGSFVYTGFRPAFVIWKNTSATGNWNTFDTSRSPYNAVDEYLRPNTADAEASGTDLIDLLSNGFKARIALTSGNTYIYMAFAENPFKQSLAR